MAAEFLFDSNGACLAFRINQYVFNTSGSWIGWLPWNDEHVITPEGKYLGTIVQGNRFNYFNKPEGDSLDYPTHPFVA